MSRTLQGPTHQQQRDVLKQELLAVKDELSSLRRDPACSGDAKLLDRVAQLTKQADAAIGTPVTKMEVPEGTGFKFEA